MGCFLFLFFLLLSLAAWWVGCSLPSACGWVGGWVWWVGDVLCE